MNYSLKIGNLKSLTQWLFILICSCLVWLFLSSFYSLQANAVSAYDDLIVPVNDVIIDDSTCDPQSLAIPWSQVFSGTTGTFGSAGGDLNFEWTGTALTNFNDIQSLWLNTVPDGSWGVSQVTGGGSDRFINVWFTDYEDVDAQFTNSGEPYNIRSLRVYRNDEELVFDDHIYSIFLAYKNNGLCDTVTISDPFSSTAQIGIIAQDLTLDVGVYGIQPLFANIDIVYPEGYDGEELPDSWNPPAPPSTLAPDIFMHSVVDFKGEFSDRNYLTTDGVLPVLCEPGALVPIIHLTLFEGTSSMGEPIDNITASASSVFWIDFKAYEERYGEFTILAAYDCGEGYEPSFSEYSEYNFEVDENGFLVNQGFEECITSEFPYVDFDACWNNMGLLVNSLSFSTISFAPDWRIQDNGCRTLGTIGDWMHAEGSNRLVCPQFSSDIRGVVTPFITFLLGIVTLGILLTKTRREQF